MTDGEVSRPRKPLPMWPILREACLLPWNRRYHFGGLLIIPVALTALMGFTDSYWLVGEELSSVALMGFLRVLPDFLIFTFFAVSCHRSVLIGEHSVSRFGVPGWSRRETRFYLWILCIYTLGYFFVILFSIALWVITAQIAGSMGNTLDNMIAVMEHPAFLYASVALLSVPFAYVVGRLSLLLPAVAVDLRPGFTSGWSQSEGNGWRVAVLVGGIPIVSAVLLGLFWAVVGQLTGTSYPQIMNELGVFSVVISALGALLSYVLATVEVAILSISFRKLSGWQPSTVSPSQAS